MGKQLSALNNRLEKFIKDQKIFFVGTAGATGKVNISPKGMDALRVLGPNKVAWLNVTGSGNETAAHVLENERMTIMFCAFEGAPLILRLYGKAKAIHPREESWSDYIGMFPSIPGARQIFILDIEMVQTSCGMAVPYFQFENQREQLNDWAAKKGTIGIQDYWEEKNQKSLDDKPTGIF